MFIETENRFDILCGSWFTYLHLRGLQGLYCMDLERDNDKQ